MGTTKGFLAALLLVAAATPAAAQAPSSLDATEAPIAEEIGGRADEAFALLERLVEINSGTYDPEGVRAVGEVLVSLAAPYADSLGGLGPGVTYLVRHAEKVDPYPADPSDPPLTAAGRARARELARTLRDAGITRILATDYRRTRDTAAPLAAALGVEVEIYEPDALEDLARSLAAGGERVLVVGHSDTTPRLVELLGGEPGPPIDEAREYDRLYVVAHPRAAEPATSRMRYGQPPVAEALPERSAGDPP